MNYVNCWDLFLPRLLDLLGREIFLRRYPAPPVIEIMNQWYVFKPTSFGKEIILNKSWTKYCSIIFSLHRWPIMFPAVLTLFIRLSWTTAHDIIIVIQLFIISYILYVISLFNVEEEYHVITCNICSM